MSTSGHITVVAGCTTVGVHHLPSDDPFEVYLYEYDTSTFRAFDRDAAEIAEEFDSDQPYMTPDSDWPYH